MFNATFLLREETFGGTLFSLTNAKRDYVTTQEFDEIKQQGSLPHNISAHFGENGYVHIVRAPNCSAPRHFSFPDTLYLEVTRACNLTCKHCFNNSGKKMRRELSHEQKLALIDTFAQSGGQEIRFTGGEPMHYSQIYDLIAHATAHPVRVSMGTNATLITPKKAVRLSESGLSQAVVSIDGMPQTHDIIRGRNAWQRSVDGIQALKDCGIVVRINITAMRTNFREIPAVVHYFHNIGVHVFIRRLLPIGRAQFNKKIFLTSDEYNWLADELHDYLYEQPTHVTGHYLRMIETRPRITLPFTRLPCSIAQRGLVVDPFGNIQLCGFMNHHKTGFIANVRNESLRSIWSRITHNDPIPWLDHGLRKYNRYADISTNCYACSA